MIRSFGFPASITALHLFTQDASLKAHPAYREAKAGGRDAALELVVKLAAPWLGEQRSRFKPGLSFVAPHAQEASGDNAIPQTLAAVCAELFGGCVDTEIVQSDRVYHTGADPMERMAARAQFVGQVTAGRDVLVDDVTNLGGTLAELSSYIQVYGGVVENVVVLVNAGRNPALVPEKKFVRLIKERFGDEITEIFGVEPAALTANEAQYLVGFQSVDQLRNRLAAAEQEIDRRLRSKGIARAPEKASSGASADQSLNAAGLGAGDS
ncbi:MAG: conjugal transfer protein TraN [Betaproteobacteria bacterium]|nr:conjugal transfer protein TraN [Candidatus Dechloromonas phosphorivorans]